MNEPQHDLDAGARVAYTPRRGKATAPPLTGTVAGAPVFDRYTSETWIPVQPDGSAADTEPALVRRGDILEFEAGG
ncbi:hypothetical protein M8542_33580 [Amycolatopsis sp. OK19-0408]|uniref:Uncharacterized protein n=1 Tax=Amycolatopsis iheyensis TaxID=2945988 RepID=A0A9X2NH73_9PSEU|nr:hypothetical protein [Amycolatopsis iheyensis]MCR6487768.1 hypothetical protein [Amycolatopsis iheyensis]